MIAEFIAFLLSLDTYSLFAVYLIFQILGFYYASKAIIYSRTPQGAVAWVFFLLSFPFIAVFAFLFFGKRKFEGYVNSRRQENQKFRSTSVFGKLFQGKSNDERTQLFHELSSLVGMPSTRGNELEILATGDEFFESLFKEIEAAKDYVLLEFYILRGDRLGTKLRDLLIRKRKEGIRVYFLYDRIGSIGLHDDFTKVLRKGNCDVYPFLASKNPIKNFQMNFRNHRKIVVIDGRVAFTGGMNIGEEYARGSKNLGPWRDLQVKVVGPAVSFIQWSFLEDWNWVIGTIPELVWECGNPTTPNEDRVIVTPTSPADSLDSGSLLICSILDSAKSRIRITTPYFVPDDSIVAAMQRALLRGVKIEVIVPKKSDHFLIDWALYSYGPELERHGVYFYHYSSGFIHQKLILVDDSTSYVGTSNFNNRSFRLSFEIGIVVDSKDFNASLQKAFETDIRQSVRAKLLQDYDISGKMKLKAGFARLFSPLL